MLCMVLCLLLVLAGATNANAEDRPLTKSPHTESSKVIAGIKSIYVDEHAEKQRERGLGLALFMELTLVEHLLELELGIAGVLPEESASQIALEPLLKTSFHVIDAINPYVAVGPVALWGAERPRFRAGGAVVVGSYVWALPHVGLDIDVGLALLSGRAAVTYEVTVSLGPVLRY